jgi:hypothetical protein
MEGRRLTDASMQCWSKAGTLIRSPFWTYTLRMARG